MSSAVGSTSRVATRAAYLAAKTRDRRSQPQGRTDPRSRATSTSQNMVMAWGHVMTGPRGCHSAGLRRRGCRAGRTDLTDSRLPDARASLPPGAEPEQAVQQRGPRGEGRAPAPSRNKTRTTSEAVPTDEATFSDGGLHSTVDDLLRFDQALAGHRLLSAAVEDTMFRPWGGAIMGFPGRTDIGLGWLLKQPRGRGGVPRRPDLRIQRRLRAAP